MDKFLMEREYTYWKIRSYWTCCYPVRGLLKQWRTSSGLSPSLDEKRPKVTKGNGKAKQLEKNGPNLLVALEASLSLLSPPS